MKRGLWVRSETGKHLFRMTEEARFEQTEDNRIIYTDGKTEVSVTDQHTSGQVNACMEWLQDQVIKPEPTVIDVQCWFILHGETEGDEEKNALAA